MNSIHNNGKNDKDLKDGLDKLDQAYRQLEQDEPPDLLDQAILNRAHRAVENKPHWMKFGWLHGLTTAAVFVLAFTVIVNQREPAPGFENGMMDNEPMLYERTNETSKESAARVDGFRQEKKIKSDDQRDMLSPLGAVAAPENIPMPTVAGDRALPAEAEEQISASVQGSLASKSQSEDKDGVISEMLLEDITMDESDTMAASPVVSELSRQVQPASIAEPIAESIENGQRARSKTELSAEDKLLAIVKLKQAGDDSWRVELDDFMESYPDYPIPDELKD